MTAGEGSLATRSIRRRKVSAWGLLLGSGPRFARDAFGPVLAFYLGWRLHGLAVGIAAASVLAIAAYAWERKHARSGLAARVGLGIATMQAVAGLVSGSVVGFLVPQVVANGAYGLAFLLSVVIGRPLAGVFVAEMYAFPPAVRTSATFRRLFSQISLVWATYLLVRSAILLLALARASVELYVVVSLVTGLPCTTALMSWSIWFGVRRFKRSREWAVV